MRINGDQEGGGMLHFVLTKHCMHITIILVARLYIQAMSLDLMLCTVLYRFLFMKKSMYVILFSEENENDVLGDSHVKCSYCSEFNAAVNKPLKDVGMEIWSCHPFDFSCVHPLAWSGAPKLRQRAYGGRFVIDSNML